MKHSAVPNNALARSGKGKRSPKVKAATKGWRVLSNLPQEKLSALLGPTVDDVMNQEFDAETIAEIRRNAARKAEQMRSFTRSEATARSAALGVLRIMRQTAGITQKELARRLEVSPPAISKMEAGDPQMSSVLLYAQALGNRLSLLIKSPKGDKVVPFNSRGAPLHRKSQAE